MTKKWKAHLKRYNDINIIIVEETMTKKWKDVVGGHGVGHRRLRETMTKKWKDLLFAQELLNGAADGLGNNDKEIESLYPSLCNGM